MELYQLRYFVALCRHEHFARAAEELFVTPPTLTNAVKKLEQEVGQTLVQKKGERFTLTPAGQELCRGAEHILAEVEALQTRLQTLNGEGVCLRVAVDHIAYTAALAESLERFARQHEKIEVQISRRAGESVRQLAAQGKIDLGIVICQQQEGLNTPKTVTEPYRWEEYGLYRPGEAGAGGGQPVVREALRGSTLELLDFAGDLRAPLQAYFAAGGVVVQPGSITNIYPESAVRLIRQRLGMAVLPLDSQRQANDIAVSPFDPPLLLEYSFVLSSHNGCSPAVRGLMEYLCREAAQE